MSAMAEIAAMIRFGITNLGAPRKAATEIVKVKKVVQETGKTATNAAKNMDFLGMSLVRLAAKFGSIMVIGYTFKRVVDLVTKPIQLFAQFEQEMANVSKTTDITGAALQSLGSDISRLSTVIPLSREELAKIATIAGQLGIRGSQQILAFTDTVAKMGFTLDMSAEEAATGMAKLDNLFRKIDIQSGVTSDHFKHMGDTVNYLSNTTVATGKDLFDFGQRVGGIAANLQMTSAEVFGFGAALKELGAKNEVAASAMVRLLTAIAGNVDAVGKALKLSTPEMVEFARLSREDMSQAVMFFLEKLGQYDSATQLAILRTKNLRLSGVRTAPWIQAMADNFGLVSDEVGKASDKMKTNNSMLEEYQRKVDTTLSKWEMTKNIITDWVSNNEVAKYWNEATKKMLTYFNKQQVLANEFKDFTKDLAGILNENKDLIEGADLKKMFGLTKDEIEGLKNLRIDIPEFNLDKIIEGLEKGIISTDKLRNAMEFLRAKGAITREEYEDLVKVTELFGKGSNEARNALISLVNKGLIKFSAELYIASQQLDYASGQTLPEAQQKLQLMQAALYAAAGQWGLYALAVKEAMGIQDVANKTIISESEKLLKELEDEAAKSAMTRKQLKAKELDEEWENIEEKMMAELAGDADLKSKLEAAEKRFAAAKAQILASMTVKKKKQLTDEEKYERDALKLKESLLKKETIFVEQQYGEQKSQLDYLLAHNLMSHEEYALAVKNLYEKLQKTRVMPQFEVDIGFISEKTVTDVQNKLAMLEALYQNDANKIIEIRQNAADRTKEITDKMVSDEEAAYQAMMEEHEIYIDSLHAEIDAYEMLYKAGIIGQEEYNQKVLALKAQLKAQDITDILYTLALKKDKSKEELDLYYSMQNVRIDLLEAIKNKNWELVREILEGTKKVENAWKNVGAEIARALGAIAGGQNIGEVGASLASNLSKILGDALGKHLQDTLSKTISSMGSVFGSMFSGLLGGLGGIFGGLVDSLFGWLNREDKTLINFTNHIDNIVGRLISTFESYLTGSESGYYKFLAELDRLTDEYARASGEYKDVIKKELEDLFFEMEVALQDLVYRAERGDKDAIDEMRRLFDMLQQIVGEGGPFAEFARQLLAKYASWFDKYGTAIDDSRKEEKESRIKMDERSEEYFNNIKDKKEKFFRKVDQHLDERQKVWLSVTDKLFMKVVDSLYRLNLNVVESLDHVVATSDEFLNLIAGETVRALVGVQEALIGVVEEMGDAIVKKIESIDVGGFGSVGGPVGGGGFLPLGGGGYMVSFMRYMEGMMGHMAMMNAGLPMGGITEAREFLGPGGRGGATININVGNLLGMDMAGFVGEAVNKFVDEQGEIKFNLAGGNLINLSTADDFRGV